MGGPSEGQCGDRGGLWKSLRRPLGGPLGSVEGPVRGLWEAVGLASERWSLGGSGLTQMLSDLRGISLG